ncbi:MarR family winged helix-turn-helix transcriptional regulator [Streptomyces sp. NPDC004286]|uniref:MarR family winged helix-turn-helix transcriptional regulator n=1 Tax=Streptomyces sp. NPDC004286 TaxID=3364696 RepID=UPI0036C9D067
MSTRWLDSQEMRAWVRLIAVLELLPGVLDAQLRRDAELTHFDYHVLVVLSQASEGQLRMTALAERTNATLPRLSHVVRRLEERGLVARFPCPEDKRATDAHLTEAGREKLAAAAPGHVATARYNVIDALTPEQLDQLAGIADAVLQRLDPDGALTRPFDGRA